MKSVFNWGKSTKEPAAAPEPEAEKPKKKKSPKVKKGKKARKKPPAAVEPAAPSSVSDAPARTEAPVPGTLADQAAAGMRQLMRRAEPLDGKKHGNLRVMQGQDFAYVSQMHTVPLSAIEFMPLARHCPIIFAGDEQIQPVALMGLRPKENLFVEENGRWTTGCYIPAILRRAPFVLMQESKGGKAGVSLSLDVESPLISETEGTPLFKDGKPTPLVAKMATFAAAYSKEQARTRVFVDALKAQNMLVERKMEITLATGQKISFTGIRVIDEDRLRHLDDAITLDWFKRGWINLAVAQILSLGNMGRLHHRANQRALSSG